MEKGRLHQLALKVGEKIRRRKGLVKAGALSLALFASGGCPKESMPNKTDNFAKKDMAEMKADASAVEFKNSENTYEGLLLNPDFKAKMIDEIAKEKTAEMQTKLIQMIDELQSDIKTAKVQNKKRQKIKGYATEVYEYGGLGGDINYCLILARAAELKLNDPFLNQCIPDPSKLPTDFKTSSHPNVSCTAFMKNARLKSTDYYIQCGDKNFKQQLNTIKTGDILILKSSHNTSTGYHAVTAASDVNDEKLTVKSFNTEYTTKITTSEIYSVLKVSKEYHHHWARALEQDQNLILSEMAKSQKKVTYAYQTNHQNFRTSNPKKTLLWDSLQEQRQP